ncbi:MAG TPA: hypothetical protein ENJ33_02365, partial [Thiothrix sp.]|nr:hypothetical protein [Thiothrix sp.]
MLFFFFYQLLLRYSFQWQRSALAIFLYCLCIAPPLYADNQTAMMQAMFAKAFGKKADAPSKSLADLRINNSSYNQQIEVYSNEQKEIDRADAAALLLVFHDVLTESFFKEIKKSLETRKKITFAHLTAMGIETSYNATNLSLEIEIKPELQKPRILTMHHQNNTTLRASNRIQPSDFSGYVNLYSILNTSTTLSAPHLKLRLDGSLNIHGYVLESTANNDGEQWTLGDTLLTYDRPDKLYRYKTGDISTLTKGFQDNYSLRGISLTKNFFMDSKLQIKPKANSTFTLSTRSEIEVYVNDKLSKRFQLDKGKYT